ncbi:hypothetical protein SNE40_013587 [Patella caerulea]|uniref:Cytochrome P450 n=1 Tax=Patella caerulea TaxID=87958 RepID=A0AAN8PNX3_PATCE
MLDAIGDVFVCSSVTWALQIVLVSLLWWRSAYPWSGVPSRVPPGPRPMIPILGNFLQLEIDPRKQFAKFRRRYGDLFSLYIGNKHIIVLNGFETLQDLLVKRGYKLSDRLETNSMEMLGGFKGIISTSGKLWREQRTVSLALLQKLDSGKQSTEDKIQEESVYLLDAIAKENGMAFDPNLLLRNAVSNITCNMLFGQRYDYDSDHFQLVLCIISETLKTVGISTAMNYFPFLEYLPGDVFGVGKMKANVKKFNEIIVDPVIKHNIDNYDPDNCNSFIALYLKEMYARRDAGEETTLDVENLEHIVTEILAAGTEATTSTLRWLLLFMATNPEVQAKCYQDVQRHVGNGRKPVLTDHDNLIYVQAVITETSRLAAVIPLGAPRSVTEDMWYKGYRLPRNSMIITNLDSVLMDEKIWGDPKVFRPERFISEDGKLIHREELIPFSMGKRKCMAETTAKSEVFLFFSHMIQRFRFITEPEKPAPLIESVFAATNAPQAFKICAFPRSTPNQI